MKFASILPPSSIPEMSALGRHKYQMALAHQVLDDEDVLVHFRRLRLEGHYVIMDNGLIETGDPMPMETLVDIGKLAWVNEIVLPDAFEDGFETVKLVDSALQQFPDPLKFVWDTPALAGLMEIKLMGVVQGKTMDEALMCYLYMLRNPKVDVIGIPKVMEKNFGRYEFVTMCYAVAHCHKPIHLLGIWTDPRELTQYKNFLEVRSCDSNFPAAAALDGTLLQQHEENKKPDISPKKFEKVPLKSMRRCESSYLVNLNIVEILAGGGLGGA